MKIRIGHDFLYFNSFNNLIKKHNLIPYEW